MYKRQTLDIHGTVVERLNAAATQADTGLESIEEEDDDISGPLTIAVDVDEPVDASTDNQPS